MRSIKMAVTGAVATIVLGLGASSASAGFGLSNTDPTGAFAGSQTAPNVLSFSGLALSCATATFDGNSNSATTGKLPLRANYGGCAIDYAGIPLAVVITTHSDWELEYVSGSASTSVTAQLNLTAPASGPALVVEVPDFACSIDFVAQDGVSDVVLANVSSPTALDGSAALTGMSYTSDCFGIDPTGTDGEYNGGFRIPGITMT